MAGSSFKRWLAAAFVVVFATPPALAADSPVDADQTAAITIGLPEGTARDVSFQFGDGKVSLELPKGASVPLDVARESNGLLRAAEVATLDADHVRVDLKIASGVVDRIEVGASGVVVRMRRRYVETAATGAGRDDEYRLGAEDKLQVAINGDPKLTQNLILDADGRASFPLVGVVAVGGLTVRQASERLTELLARDYLVDPRVDLQIVEYKSQWVMVTGEVGKPGRVPLRGGATLKDALADADGMTVGAGDEIVISRDAEDGKGKVQIPVDRSAFERAEINPPLKTGDIVNVAARPYVYVNGEVRSPGKYPLERGMTLLKAISTAGSLTEWASEKGVQIISEGAKQQKRTYSLREIRDLKTPDPALKGGDVVYVKRRFL